MKAKQFVACLYAKKAAEYKNFISGVPYSEISDIAEIIREIEHFHLPEVTNLICSSDILLLLPWAAGYRKLAESYRADPFSVRSLIEALSNEEIERDILIYNCEAINSRLLHTVQVVEEKRDKASIFIKQAKAKVRDRKKKLEELSSAIITEELAQPKNDELTNTNESITTTETPSEHIVAENAIDLCAEKQKLEEEISNLEERIAKAEKEKEEIFAFQKKNKSTLDTIKNYRSFSDGSSEDIVREKVYAIIEELQVPSPFEYIQGFLRTGVVDDEFSEYLRDAIFVKKFLNAFDHREYLPYAYPVLVNLYETGSIDLEDEMFTSFISAHMDGLAKYLCEVHNEIADGLAKEENAFLYDFAIRCVVLSDKGISQLSELWDCLDSNEWLNLVNRIEALDIDRLEKILPKFIHGLSSQTIRQFISMITDGNLSTKIDTVDLFSELLHCYDPEDQDAVIYILREYNLSKKKTQKKVDALSRRINRQAQDSFSALYTHVIQLEELAMSLRYTEGSIECKLVARQLVDAVVNLRTGLSAIGIDPIVDPEIWKNQEPFEFDPEKHSSAEPHERGQRVTARTMGFSYSDDEEAVQYLPAKLNGKIKRSIDTKSTKSFTIKNQKAGKKPGFYPGKNGFNKQQSFHVHSKEGGKRK